MRKVEVKLNRTVLLQNRDGDYFCLGCRKEFGVISTDNDIGFCDIPYCCPCCGAVVHKVIMLNDEEDSFYDSWIEVVAE